MTRTAREIVIQIHTLSPDYCDGCEHLSPPGYNKSGDIWCRAHGCRILPNPEPKYRRDYYCRPAVCTQSEQDLRAMVANKTQHYYVAGPGVLKGPGICVTPLPDCPTVWSQHNKT